MSRTSKTVLACGVLVSLAIVTSALLLTRGSPKRQSPIQSGTGIRPITRGPRNLALQPEALRVARQLGNRFASTRTSSVLVGTLTIAGNQQPLTVTRRQTQMDEEVNWAMAQFVLVENPVTTGK